MSDRTIALRRQQYAELTHLLLEHNPVETTLWDVVDLLGRMAREGVSGPATETCCWCASTLERWVVVDRSAYCPPDRKDCSVVASLLSAAQRRR